LANAFNQETVSYFRIAGAGSLGLLIGLILFSFPAAAEVYPVSGVWTAIDTDFPAAANETCLAVKTFGVEAVAKKSVSEMIIFAKDKRYDVNRSKRHMASSASLRQPFATFDITDVEGKYRSLGVDGRGLLAGHLSCGRSMLNLHDAVRPPVHSPISSAFSRCRILPVPVWAGPHRAGEAFQLLLVGWRWRAFEPKAYRLRVHSVILSNTQGRGCCPRVGPFLHHSLL
jgi:hypothetical protein